MQDFATDRISPELLRLARAENARLAGLSRRRKLSPEQLSQIARHASLARWAKAGRSAENQAPDRNSPSAADAELARLVTLHASRRTADTEPRWREAFRLARRAGHPAGALAEVARRWEDQVRPVREAVERDPERLLVQSMPLLLAILRTYDD